MGSQPVVASGALRTMEELAKAKPLPVPLEPPGKYFHGLLFEPDCHLCPLRYQTKVYPDGPIPAKRVFIGEEPGNKEVREGKGFIGPSGQLLWYLEAKVGNPPRSFTWVTNGSLCKSREIILETGAVLSVQEVKALAAVACRRRLLWEIRYVTQDDPDAVIQPLGNWAHWAVTNFPKPRIFAHRGSVVKIDLKALCEKLYGTS